MSGIQDAFEENLSLRPVQVVMDLERLGTLHPYRLSFMRTLTRRMQREKWKFRKTIRNLDPDGYGVVVFEIQAPQTLFSFVAFTQDLDPEMRSDRVIAEKWDMTVTLCEGVVDADRLEQLRKNVPLQEKGRLDARSITLSRANKSARNFENVIADLAVGQQPDIKALANIGYLYRTTAVYGSGKFGMADWEKVRTCYPDLARPFSAEMLTCFMVRHLSFELADHIASHRAPEMAVKLDDNIKRYMGIGNATGLGMAPYLINHPILISRWIEVREIALAQIQGCQETFHHRQPILMDLLKRATQHLLEIDTANTDQNALNATVRGEVEILTQALEENSLKLKKWQDFLLHTEKNLSVGAQELVHSVILEIFPESVDPLEELLNIEESYKLDGTMPVSALSNIIETKYQWALLYDFNNPSAQGAFWYRSEEKMEPRLGNRYGEAGVDKEMFMGIARAVQTCHQDLCSFRQDSPDKCVAEFVLSHPGHRKTIRRIQTMAQTEYGEIQANLLDEDVMPIHLLRCKLSFFGVSKFDPRSRLWVRNTMFQGAPLVADISTSFSEDWCFPVMPTLVN